MWVAMLEIKTENILGHLINFKITIVNSLHVNIKNTDFLKKKIFSKTKNVNVKSNIVLRIYKSLSCLMKDSLNQVSATACYLLNVLFWLESMKKILGFT